MSADPDDAPKRAKRTKRQPTGDYDAGYCRPPKAHQFKKGEPSHNPKGRPPRRVKHRSVFEEVSQKKIAYTAGDKTRTASLIELSMQRLLDAAVKGDRKAQAELLKLWRKVQVAKANDPAPPQGPIPMTVFVDGVPQPRSVPEAPRSPRRKADRKRATKRKWEHPRDIFNRLAGRTILVREGKARKRMTYEQAIWRSIFAGALKGDPKALSLVNRFVDLRQSREGFRPSDIIDENGVLRVTINLGKPPGLLDDERQREQDIDGDKEEEN